MVMKNIFLILGLVCITSNLAAMQQAKQYRSNLIADAMVIENRNPESKTPAIPAMSQAEAIRAVDNSFAYFERTATPKSAAFEAYADFCAGRILVQEEYDYIQEYSEDVYKSIVAGTWQPGSEDDKEKEVIFALKWACDHNDLKTAEDLVAHYECNPDNIKINDQKMCDHLTAVYQFVFDVNDPAKIDELLSENQDLKRFIEPLLASVASYGMVDMVKHLLKNYATCISGDMLTKLLERMKKLVAQTEEEATQIKLQTIVVCLGFHLKLITKQA